MIHFFSEIDFTLTNNKLAEKAINALIINENKTLGELNYIFCDDEYLLKINQEYLKHNFYTDIITFDYCTKNTISGDIYISIERVKENATTLKQPFDKELNRILYHGVLHLCGYADKTKEEKEIMTQKEDYYLNLQT